VNLVRTECIVNTNTNIISHLVVMAGTKLTINATLNIGNTTGENWETALHVHSGGEISMSNSSGVINMDNGTTTTGTGGSGGTGGLGYCFTVNGTFTMSAGNAYVDDDMIVTGTVTQSGGNIYLGYHPSTGAKSYDGALYVSGADYAAYNHSAGNLYVGRRFYTSGGYGSYESGKGYYRGSGTSTVTVGAYSGSTEPQIIVSDNANNSYLNNLVISGNIVLYTQPSIPLIINGLFTINTGSSLNTQSNSMIIGGNWNNNGTFTPGTGTVTFNGTTAISGSTASHDFYNITINSGKSLTAPGGNMNVSGNWTNNGTFTPGTETVTFNGTTAISGSTASHNFYNITINNSKSLTAPDGNLNVAGNWTNNGIFSAGTGTVVLNGTGAQVIGGTANTTFYNLNVNRSTTSNALIFGDAVNSGKTFTVDNTFTWTDNNDMIRIGQTGASGQRLIVPTINIPAGCTLQFDNNTANYLDINNGGATVSLLANGTLIQGIGTVTFNGTEAQYLRSSYDISFYNLVVNRNTVNAFTIGNSGTTNITFAVTNSFSWVDYDDIIILGLTASGQTLSVPSITIPAGCTLQDASNGALLHHINVSGNWINNGTFTAGNGTVVFNGNAPQTITSGSSSFNNIIFNSTGIGNADIVLADDLHVEGQASFSDGIVNTGSNKLVFGTSASTNAGTASSFVDGKVEKTNCTGLFTLPTGNVVSRDLGSGTQTYIMWAPIGLNPASPATVNARYLFSNEGLNTWWYHDWTHESPLTHTSSREYWLVNSSVNLSATLYWKNNSPCSVHDFCEEGTGTFMSDDLTVAYWSGMWKNAGGSVSGSSENGLITSGSIPLGSIGSKGETQITFGSKNPDLSLPVELLSFGAECKDGSVLLSWTTASEINNDYFELERSDDGTNWNVIAHVEGAGNSNEELKYSFIEIIKISGIVYYRLRQVDYDGSSKLSDMVQVRCNDDLIKPSVMLYPNPFNNQLFVATENWDMNSLDMELYDMLGKKLATWSFDGVSPEFVKQLDIADLPPAMYVVKIKTSTGITVRKIEKK
ncbi:MAG TPA: T9SS type A sorting domain-containing protein, partial [Bacteroidales bacterium]|nr:T9SS type A sorting domain-containing protein [Bacteroidales bacterium]